MKRYSPKEIEPKWQKIWEETKLYQVAEDSKRKKYYELEYFPYPSGATMHVGHVRNYAISDVWARFMRMQGFNVLHPMGWDSFGLPAENFAIKTGTPPRKTTDDNIKTFKRQLQQMGFSYDWSREIDSSSPEYYRWTQWCFLLLHKKGLAYRGTGLQNWCPKDQTVLANEQVLNDGTCERCGTKVEKKELKQWFFKITDFADRLLNDLDELDWPENIKQMQRNWIGRSEGINITYEVDGTAEKLVCFTTRPDTNFGATFVVIAPEHEFSRRVANGDFKPKTGEDHSSKVATYLNKTGQKTELDRKEEGSKKTGVFTGFYATNKLNGKKMPIWVADFVLGGFGTGAVVGVPGHDMRDFEFASEFKLPIERVVIGPDGDESEITRPEQVSETAGKMVNSGFLNGMDIHQATEKIKDFMVKEGWGERVTNYRLRDWLISRQRYWGAPIPIIHCPKDGEIEVPLEQLPVVLPEVKDYQPSGDGRSPLAKINEFVNTTCPKCGGPAERETDTMDGFACSSWYFLRFADPHNTKMPWDKQKADYWMPVDTYVGGAEHAVMHLLYARFWTKVFYDEGLLSAKEPFRSLRNQGMIGGADGRKMGKRYGNAVTPDDLIGKGYGADSLRLFELFIAPYNQDVDWNVNGVDGTLRFLNRAWTLIQSYIDCEGTGSVANQTEIETQALAVLHKTIRKVTADTKSFSLNTSVSALMELLNELYKIKVKLPLNASQEWQQILETFVLMLAPLAPHVAEEMWQDLGNEESVHLQHWPKFDEKYLKEDFVTIVVQVNGKVRANITLPAGVDQETMISDAKKDEKIMQYLAGKTVVKTIAVPQKLVNFVVK